MKVQIRSKLGSQSGSRRGIGILVVALLVAAGCG